MRISHFFDKNKNLIVKTPEDVANFVHIIEGIGGDELHGDSELAHEYEDKLHVAVLKAVVQDKPNAKAMAAIALKTLSLPFNRWYS